MSRETGVDRLRARAIDLARQHVPRDEIAKRLSRSRRTIDSYLAGVKVPDRTSPLSSSGETPHAEPFTEPKRWLNYGYAGDLLTPPQDPILAAVPQMRQTITNPAVQQMDDEEIAEIIAKALSDPEHTEENDWPSGALTERLWGGSTAHTSSEIVNAIVADASRGSHAELSQYDIAAHVSSCLELRETGRVLANLLAHPSTSDETLTEVAESADKLEAGGYAIRILSARYHGQTVMSREMFCADAKRRFGNLVADFGQEQIEMENNGSLWFRRSGMATDCDYVSEELECIKPSADKSPQQIVAVIDGFMERILDMLANADHYLKEDPRFGSNTQGEDALVDYGRRVAVFRESLESSIVNKSPL